MDQRIEGQASETLLSSRCLGGSSEWGGGVRGGISDCGDEEQGESNYASSSESRAAVKFVIFRRGKLWRRRTS